MWTGVWTPYDEDTSVEDPQIPLRLGLSQNVPNPFNPSTTIRFSLPSDYAGLVTLSVYDVLGRRVRTLLSGPMEAGTHAVTWLGRDDKGHLTASGVYLYRLVTETGQRQGRMTLVR